MDNYKLINVNIFNPAFQDVKARCEYLYCNNSENCKIYMQGKCVSEPQFLNIINCPHSKSNIESGFTKKARKFYTWQESKKEKHKEVLNVIKIDNKKIAECGDYIYLPYPYLKNYVNTLSFIINSHFCKKEDFTVEAIEQIVKFRPKALMGGEIKEFQEKHVYLFLQHLKEELPEKYLEFSKTHADILEQYIDKSQDYTGRRAYIKTLRVGTSVKDNRGNKFVWDGKKLVCEEYKSAMLPFGVNKGYMEIIPEEESTIEITDNNQVDENTEFKN